MQLSIPPIAIVGGVLFVAEFITPRLAIASAAILSGIAFVLMGKSAKL